MTLLFIHPIYNSLLLLIPNSHSFPSLLPPPSWQPQVSVSVSLFLFLRYVDLYHILDSYISNIIWYPSFSFYLALLSMIISRSIHVAVDALFHSFLWLSNIPLCVCTHTYVPYIFPFICRWTVGLFLCLGCCK